MIDHFLKTWWKPVILYLTIYFTYILGLFQNIKFIIETFDYLLILSIFIVIASSVYVIYRSKWYYIINQLGIICISLYYLIPLLMFYPYDNFADDLQIPKNIKFDKPTTHIDTLTIRKEKTLEIENGFQPGIYEFYFWYKPTEKGELYLKASEITHNIPLSEQRIKDKTSIEAEPNDSLQLFHKVFTIYEGDWGKFYGSKISVYFQPHNKPEQKLIEKNYIVEGWMR